MKGMNRIEPLGMEWFPICDENDDHDPYRLNGVTVRDDGEIDIYDGCGAVVELAAWEADRLYEVLKERAIRVGPSSESNDDALASLDRELRGHPMGEPHAVAPGVPVAVKTGTTNEGVEG